MASIIKGLGGLLPKRVQKGFVGYDLEGNSYFELPNPMGGRMKRTVEYKVNRDLAEYTSGQHRLPVQWTTWLSHTRSNPPTTSELQSDTTRQSKLKPLIEAIEARETAERIRQGYLPDPSLNNEGVKPIAGPSTNTNTNTNTAQINTKPSFTVPDQRPIEQTGQPASSPTQANTNKREGVVSESVPAPGATVDPGKNDDPAGLRRLAEEDTKRRIEQRGGEADLRVGNGSVEGVDIGGGGGLAPRRRGKK